MVPVCVETDWFGSWFEMAVLGCRSLVLVIRSIQLSAHGFCCHVVCSVIFSELVSSNSASVEGVGNISSIKTSRNNDRVKYGFFIVFLSFTVRAHATLRHIQTWMSCPLYFIIHSPCTRDAPTYTKLEWLVHCILLFTVCAHVTSDKCGAHSGSPQQLSTLVLNSRDQQGNLWLPPKICLENNLTATFPSKYSHKIYWYDAIGTINPFKKLKHALELKLSNF